MKLLCLTDKLRESNLSNLFLEQLEGTFTDTHHELEVYPLIQEDLAYCLGCLACWSNNTSRCRFNDRVPELESRLPGTTCIIYLSPVVYGGFSPVIKTLIEKGFGSKLSDKTLYPQIHIGYGEVISDEEKSCFLDITYKHMGNADIVHPKLSSNRVEAFVIRSPEDCSSVMSGINQIFPFRSVS